MSTYRQTLERHPFALTDQQTTHQTEALIARSMATYDTPDVYRTLYTCLDLTSLNATDTRNSIWQLAETVNAFEGSRPDVGNVAAICVYPNFVATLKEALTADVRIACVSGGFPASQTFTEAKIAETGLAVADGADEIDTVIRLGAYLEGEYEEMGEELFEIKQACRGARLKAILETGALPSAADVHRASIIALCSEVDFLKTSTGKHYPGATPEAVYAMCQAIKSWYTATGRKAGIKISGGVAEVADAVKYYTIVRETLGNEWCSPTLFRIGASRLADKLLAAIEE